MISNSYLLFTIKKCYREIPLLDTNMDTYICSLLTLSILFFSRMLQSILG